MKTELIKNQNATGGGLAVNITGKYVSNRHALASLEKMTAGRARKIIEHRLNISISAKQLVKDFTLLFDKEPEWHHAGFYKNSSGSTMGRTFFFSETDIENFVSEYYKLENIKQLKQEVEQTNVIGFYWKFEPYTGRYGKKFFKKIVYLYDGLEKNKPNKFSPCSIQEWENSDLYDGKEFFGYDTPTL